MKKRKSLNKVEPYLGPLIEFTDGCIIYSDRWSGSSVPSSYTIAKWATVSTVRTYAKSGQRFKNAPFGGSVTTIFSTQSAQRQPVSPTSAVKTSIRWQFAEIIWSSLKSTVFNTLGKACASPSGFRTTRKFEYKWAACDLFYLRHGFAWPRCRMASILQRGSPHFVFFWLVLVDY